MPVNKANDSINRQLMHVAGAFYYTPALLSSSSCICYVVEGAYAVRWSDRDALEGDDERYLKITSTL